MGTKMLIPLDGSELAEAALAYAEAIGKALGWSAVLYSVVPRVSERSSPHLPRTPVVEAGAEVWERWETRERAADEETQHEEAAALDGLSAAADRLQAAGLRVEREIGVGNAQEALVHRAAHDDIALVVMASHGRTGLARLFRGSVTAGVVEHSERPILVVRPFLDAEHRVDLEHADRLPPEQADAVRKAIAAAG